MSYSHLHSISFENLYENQMPIDYFVYPLGS